MQLAMLLTKTKDTNYIFNKSGSLWDSALFVLSGLVGILTRVLTNMDMRFGR